MGAEKVQLYLGLNMGLEVLLFGSWGQTPKYFEENHVVVVENTFGKGHQRAHTTEELATLMAFAHFFITMTTPKSVCILLDRL